jgi:uncharacterized protein YukE
MADVTQLVRALDRYSRELDRHNALVADAFRGLERSLGRLSSVYEGVAAREFKAHWARTQAGLRDYESGARSIGGLLDERLQALRAADRPEGL